MVGNRGANTVYRLYRKLAHLNCIFYTDHWRAFAKVLPAERHVQGKQHTHRIESNNSDTRQQINRFTRKSKCVSHAEEMINLTLKGWAAMKLPEVFKPLQKIALSICN